MIDPTQDYEYEPIFGSHGTSVPPPNVHPESTTDSFADEAEQATQRVCDDAVQIGELVTDAAQTLRRLAMDCVSDVTAVVRQTVSARPIAAIATAAAAGYVLARLRGGRRG